MARTPKDLYGGSTAYTPPTLAEWAEHSRSGDLESGRAFKAIQIVPLATRFSSNASVSFYGFARPGITVGASYWRIMRASHDGTFLDFADGNDLFDNQWTDRENLVYL
jgi:hypothetical protein